MSERKPKQVVAHPNDKELRDLWTRRSDLDETEWVRLYVIVKDALRNWRPSILRSLPEDHETYIEEFFQDKVYRPDLASRIDHVGALRSDAYENFLKDVLRRQNRRPIEVVGDEDNDEEVWGISGTETGGTSSELDDSLWSALHEESGMSVEEVAQSARKWLDASDVWVGIYLGLHNCPDAKDSDPLYKLARTYQVANYHHKAELLGITDKRDAGYEKTLLGRWLTQDIRLELSPESLSVFAALKILCLAALMWAEDQEKPS